MSTNEFEKVEVNDENVGKTANENGVFDFEQYQKKNEGYIQKFFYWLNDHLKGLKKNIKAISILGIISVIIAGIECYKVWTEDNAGAVIERLYQESNTNVATMQNMIKVVQLPDSLENTEEVQRLRLHQNRILQYGILCNSFLENINSYNKNRFSVKDKTSQEDLYSEVSWLLETLIYMTNFRLEVNTEFTSIAMDWFLESDTLPLYVIGLSNMQSINNVDNSFLNVMRETHQEYLGIGNMAERINIVADMLLSDDLVQFCKTANRKHVLFLNAINVRLLDIKNKEMEKISRISKNNNSQTVLQEYLRSNGFK